MIVKKQGNVFVVKTRYSESEYEEFKKYYFLSIEAVEDFINGRWAEDVSNNKHFMSYYEVVMDIYERVDYSVEYE